MKHMTHILLTTAALTLGAEAASDTCTAEYKAKRDNPLELFYDVVQISGPCTMANAEAQLTDILSRDGLVLLKVLSVVES